MPRRVIPDEELVRKNIVEYITLGSPIETALDAVGIVRSTYDRWKQKHREFREDIKKALGMSVINLLTEIQADKSWQSKAWILERRFPQKFAKREYVEQRTEHSVANLTKKEEERIAKEFNLIKTERLVTQKPLSLVDSNGSSQDAQE